MAAALLRPHILLIAGLAAATFGWLYDGRANWPAAGWVAFDWLLLNFWNRLADVREDQLNAVPGASFAAAHDRLLFAAAAAAWILSFFATLRFGFGFNGLRCGFQAGGFVYNYRVLPGGRRFKDLLGIKNLAAGMLFAVSDLGYPLLLRQGVRPVGWAEVLVLGAFFLPLEMTYELVYDLRDAVGDRLAGLRTVPVTFGESRTRQAIDGLLAVSALSLVLGFFGKVLFFEEALLIAAPIQQALAMRLAFAQRVDAAGAIGLTYLGAAQLASFLIWTGLGWSLRPPGWR